MKSLISILIVEDDVWIAHDIEDILQEVGYEIIYKAKDYDTAKRIIDTTHIDMVLLDINLLGDKTGIDLANYIRLYHKIPFIYITSSNDSDTILNLRQTRPSAFLVKPFSKIDLLTNTKIDVSLDWKFSADKKIIEVFAIVLLPVIIGMLINAKFPDFSKKSEKPFKIASAVFLVAIIILAVLKDRDKILEYFQQVGLAALVFNLASMAVGYFIPILLKVGKKEAIAIGMEIGIHNGTLAIFIALNVLNNPAMSFPPAVYSLIMFFTAAAFGWWVSRKHNSEI
jgi:CheY-like chemotaxis protein